MATKNPKGPIRTQDEKNHAREADEKARQLIITLRPMNRPEAERYISENKPTSDVIVGMAFYANHFASRQPRPDALGVVIAEILKAKPLASTDDVIDALRAHAGIVPAIIEVHADGTVEWEDNGKLKESKRSDIAKRISRIKKIVGSR